MLLCLWICGLPFALSSCAEETKTIVYINSYHEGFPPSDQITRGLLEHLPADSFQVHSYFMDTKRNPTEAYISQRAAELLDSIQIQNPDVLIVSDDNALKYLALPNFTGKSPAHCILRGELEC